MGNISLFEKDSKEYERLDKFCKYMNENTPDRFHFFIKDMYFDYGQNWMYTGLITEDLLDRKTGYLLEEGKGDTWQTLNPNEHNKLLDASEEELEKVFEELSNAVTDGFCKNLYAPRICETEKLLIVSNENDAVSTSNYKGYESLKDAVGGIIEHIGEIDINETKCDIYCNEEFLLIDDEKFNKINAFASMICNTPIYGNIVFVPQVMTEDGIDNRGFIDTTIDGEQQIGECWIAEDLIMRTINRNKKEIEAIHADYDGNKPEPTIGFIDIENDIDFDDL